MQRGHAAEHRAGQLMPDFATTATLENLPHDRERLVISCLHEALSWRVQRRANTSGCLLPMPMCTAWTWRGCPTDEPSTPHRTRRAAREDQRCTPTVASFHA